MDTQCGPIPLPYREVRGPGCDPSSTASNRQALFAPGTVPPDFATPHLHPSNSDGALQVLRPLATAAVERKLRGQMTFPEFKSMGDMILWVRMLGPCPSCDAL